MAMFSCHFFEKLAQTYFCDGVISGGKKKNLSQGEYFNYGNYKHCNLVGHQT